MNQDMLKDPEFKKPMKGLDFNPARIKLPDEILVMPKLNGVRIRWDVTHQCFRFNSGLMVQSCDHLVERVRQSEKLRWLPLDGEAYNHDQAISFSTINGLARRKQSSAETEVLQLHLFDIAAYGAPYTKVRRMEVIERLFDEELVMQGASIQQVPWALYAPTDIDRVFKQCLADRYEGIMIADPEARYTEGKGKWMWKHKSVHSAEYGFVGFVYATEGRNVGTFASIELMMDDGRTFNCAGISDDTKVKLLKDTPAPGTPITVEYGDLSDTGVPIFPRYVDVRYDQ